MTTTTRRITKMTTHSSRGYVAIHCEHIAAETTMVRCTAKKDMQRTGFNGASVEIKAGQEFYLVRAASLGENMFYIVLVGVTGAKKCSCPAAKPCKHETDVQAREELRTPRQVPSSVVRREVIVSAAPPSRSQDSTMIAAPLNGQRGFSLLR